MKNILLITLLSLTVMSTNTQAADEGIKVHGHWKFEMYNSDGSFNHKIEFENSLTSTGAEALLALIGGGEAREKWFVNLVGDVATGDDPCKDNNLSVVPCILSIPPLEPSFTEVFLLTQTFDDSNNPTKIIFSGSMTTASGLTNPNIGKVSTIIGTCPNTTINLCSSNYQQREFTSKTISPPIQLSDGQIVQVTVEISFS